jgi:hypothetical protein
MRRVLPFLIAALPLVAQDASIGLRADILAPTGDLRNVTDTQLGLGGAVVVNIPLGDVASGWVLRPLVGGQFIPKGNNLGLASTKTDVSTLDLMLESLWYPIGDITRAPFLVVSVGLQHWRENSTGAYPSTFSVTRIGANAGVGYQITSSLSADLRGFWSPVSPTLTASGVMLAATVTF